jgi:DNA polymerase alpha subunit A
VKTHTRVPIAPTERLANLGVESSSEDFDKYVDLSMDDFMEIEDDDLHPAIKKEAKERDMPKTTNSAPMVEDTKPNDGSSTNASSASVLEDDGSLRFFWLDYLELDGKLYFTGKVKDKTTSTWASCFSHFRKHRKEPLYSST